MLPGAWPRPPPGRKTWTAPSRRAIRVCQTETKTYFPHIWSWLSCRIILLLQFPVILVTQSTVCRAFSVRPVICAYHCLWLLSCPLFRFTINYSIVCSLYFDRLYATIIYTQRIAYISFNFRWSDSNGRGQRAADAYESSRCGDLLLLSDHLQWTGKKPQALTCTYDWSDTESTTNSSLRHKNHGKLKEIDNALRIYYRSV